MARPVGQFKQKKDECLQLLRELAGLGVCFATSSFLGKKLNRGEKQIQNYLKALKTEGAIEIVTSKAVRDKKDGGYYRKRIIRIASHIGPVYRAPKKRVLWDEMWENVEIQPEDTSEISARLNEEAYRRIQEEDAQKAADQALFDSLNPDKQIDHDAILREMYAELAEQGIHIIL